MTDREKLVEIVCNAIQEVDCIAHCNHPPCYKVHHVVDELISHGVTVRETTSEDFLANVKDLERIHYPDFETMHSVLDLAMEELLIELGYEAAVDFIRDQDRWYS